MPKPIRVKTQADVNQERGCLGCAGCLVVCFVGLVVVILAAAGIFAGVASAG